MNRTSPSREFHISRAARERYHFDLSIYSLHGNVVLADFHAARLFAQRMNAKRDLARFPEQAVRAGQINALGLMDEILHLVIALYREQRSPAVLAEALEWLESRLGRGRVDEALRRFAAEFPPLPVYRGDLSPEDYLAGASDGLPNRQALLEEMLLLHLANRNPACAPFLELFDDSALRRDTAYPEMMTALHSFFDTRPPFGPDAQNLVDMLHSPAVAVPHSLFGQLEYIREHWGYLVGKYVYRLLRGLDLIREEEKMAWAGPGPSRVYDFAGPEPEEEQFSPDREWMPNLVLLARNTYVWLDQLSRQYGRPITRLDQIPDRELEIMARRGFTGLWLIGLWERSRASQRIKQMCGNPEAVASAYALFDYQIAADLGGEAAYRALRERAWRYGIRLASDMVPNHVGLDGLWVIEHPDWFISLDHSPFPSYTFEGPDLSWHAEVGLYLEDHYYTRTDAAVVFKRVDRRNGETRYIYHGNDGTGLPWNDTAQLNYLNPAVREAVIQTILHVARLFPIIRFDAAMTLTKRHYRRLWFPEPGHGGAIPSRAEHGMTKAEFDARMPNEFWREVVDRVAEEAPDTLLLAEAFWLMEGYFVRTLGMHRVYNSAFMNMLRDEENEKYRRVIKNTLEFDPRILKRYVNFMNNPDERTAVEQFGKGDKYFGVCTLLATMPGLPLFGHGQVEGFAEKYGMEYRRAYWDEQPDPYLVERHEREIFPLLRRRYLFAEVDNFLLYDLVTSEGEVNEEVFAYSNRVGEERALVIYHNRYAEARGRIRISTPYVPVGPDGIRPPARRKSLGEGLGLRDADRYFTIFRDHLTGLEYIRNNRELWEQGLYVELGAYRCHVFLDFREVEDDDGGRYARLAAYLDGRGVPDIEEALQEIFWQPVWQPFRALVTEEVLKRVAGRDGGDGWLEEVEGKIVALLRGVKEVTGGDGDEAVIARAARVKLESYLALADRPPARPLPCATWLLIHPLGRVVDEENAPQITRSWLDEWLLSRLLESALRDCGLDEGAAEWEGTLVKVLIAHQRWFEEPRARRLVETWLQDGDVRRLIQVHRYRGVLWFNKESFEQLLDGLLCVALVTPEADGEWCRAVVERIKEAADGAGYRVEALLEMVGLRAVQAGGEAGEE